MSQAEALGAVVENGGVRFRLHAPRATGVDLCLYDDTEGPERERISMEADGDAGWQTVVEGIGAGQLYGYRVDGPHRPAEGDRFNPDKLLIDPRAGAVAGSVRRNPALLEDAESDSAPWQARSVVVDPSFDWSGDRPPRTPWSDTVIYEAHVRGMTRLHPGVSEEHRGTYLGLAAPAVIEHLLALGVTAVELMPVQHFTAERHLMERRLPNYWGYSPLAWFAPHAGYATDGGHLPGAAVEEFQTMVRELHRAGLEVLLDVVFNHTAEGDASGPTLSLRGIDNRLYYLTDPADRSRYVDFTGCGNTVHAGHPAVAELILDCLRYWVREMRVDGFRFDLATSLGRENGEFSSRASLLEAIGSDPVLSRVKLIAEPWDLGPGGYRLGEFPPGWSGWNDRFRDTARSFWRGDPGRRADLATRLAGSRDLFAAKRRGPLGGINYVTCHDGFTLADLVAYEEKHNLDNLEGNRDGHDQNLSRNWGAEGPTDSPEILESRDRARRNQMATLALSHGVPMLAHGDELGRSQRGNNNAYCHDGPLTWIDWSLEARDERFLDFTRRLFALRRELGGFGSEEFPSEADLVWLGGDGRPLADEAWEDSEDRLLGVLGLGRSGGRWLLWANAAEDSRQVALPGTGHPEGWLEVLNTARPESRRRVEGSLEAEPFSMILLRSEGS